MKNPMQIRPVNFNELDVILDLHFKGLEHEFSHLNRMIPLKQTNPDGRLSLKRVLAQMMENGEGVIFSAEEKGECVGYCLVVKKVYPSEMPCVCGCINGMYVKETRRRQGIGRALFAKACAWLKKQGISSVELTHMLNDDVAGRFWQKMGFTKVQYLCAHKI